MKCLALVTAVPIASAPNAKLLRRAVLALLLVPATALVSACGGGGGGSIVSAPPPIAAPAPVPMPSPTLVSTAVTVTTIASPATRQGTFETIALIDNRLAAPSEFKIANQQAGPSSNEVTYIIEFASPELPGNSSSLTSTIKAWSAVANPDGHVAVNKENFGPPYEYPIRFGEKLIATYHYSDGSQTVIDTALEPGNGTHPKIEYRQGTSEKTTLVIGGGNTIQHQLVYNVGLSHVSLGEWGWTGARPDGSAIGVGRVYFVHGERTPAAEIPASGTATYSAASLGSDGYGNPAYAPIAIALTADFGQRSISAQLNRDDSLTGDFFGETVAVFGVDLRGTGPIASPGSFSIPLSGTVTDPNFGPNNIYQVTGLLDGAFFGPNASQVGGVFAVGIPAGTLVRDTFVGTRN